MAGRAFDGCGCAELLEELGFSLLGLIADSGAEAATVLLEELRDLVAVLLRECSCNLGGNISLWA